MPVKAEKELSLQGLISVIQEHPEAAGKLRFIGSLENRPTVTSYPNPTAYFGVEWRKMRTLLQKIRPYQGFLTAAAAGFTAFVNIYALQSLLPLLARTFQTDSRSVSLAVSATTLAVALASPFCGWLVSRLSRGAVMRLSVTGLCLTGFLAALSGSLNQLILWRFCQGLFLPLLISGVLSFMSCDFPKNQLGRATSYYVTWTIVGGFAGRWTAGMAAAMFGWRPALLILGIMNALAGAVLLGCTQHKGARIKSKESPNVKSFLATLGEPALRSVYAIGFCSLFTMVGGFTYVTFYLSQAPFLLGPDDLGNIFCVYLLGMAATPALGNVLPEWGSAKAIRLTAQVAVGGLLLTLVAGGRLRPGTPLRWRFRNSGGRQLFHRPDRSSRKGNPFPGAQVGGCGTLFEFLLPGRLLGWCRPGIRLGSQKLGGLRYLVGDRPTPHLPSEFKTQTLAAASAAGATAV